MPKTPSSIRADREEVGSDGGGSTGEAAQPLPPEPQQATQRATEDSADREARIREAAYDAYMRRGGEPGDEVQDWLNAEAQIDVPRGRGQ